MQLRRLFCPLIAALVAPIIAPILVLTLAAPVNAAPVNAAAVNAAADAPTPDSPGAALPASDALASAAELPDAPTPQTGSSSSSSSTSTSGQAQPQPDGQQTEHEKAEQQMKAQEKQRVAGIVPSFNVSYIGDAASMSAGQKIRLAFRSQIDPYAFGIAAIVAGIGEAKDDNPGFGWGPTGYFERAGAAYLDAFDGAMIGNGFLPALLHQDPRYFRMGHGSFHHRFLYALSTSFICKHDHTGKWEPNYSNVGGNIASGAISNLYYSNGTGVVHTFTDGLTVTAEGTFGGVLQEFWPDISRKLFHKDPTNGRDAEMRAADKAKKLGIQQNTQPAANQDAKPPQQ